MTRFVVGDIVQIDNLEPNHESFKEGGERGVVASVDGVGCVVDHFNGKRGIFWFYHHLIHAGEQLAIEVLGEDYFD